MIVLFNLLKFGKLQQKTSTKKWRSYETIRSEEEQNIHIIQNAQVTHKDRQSPHYNAFDGHR